MKVVTFMSIMVYCMSHKMGKKKVVDVYTAAMQGVEVNLYDRCTE